MTNFHLHGKKTGGTIAAFVCKNGLSVPVLDALKWPAKTDSSHKSRACVFAVRSGSCYTCT